MCLLLCYSCYVCIPRSFLAINVCNQGKTLCSPCIFWLLNFEAIRKGRSRFCQTLPRYRTENCNVWSVLGFLRLIFFIRAFFRRRWEWTMVEWHWQGKEDVAGDRFVTLLLDIMTDETQSVNGWDSLVWWFLCCIDILSNLWLSGYLEALILKTF